MTTDRPSELEGRYFPTGSSASFDCTLSGEPPELLIRNHQDGSELVVSMVEVSDRLGSVVRKISFEDGSVFECADNEAVDLFFGHGSRFFSRLTRAEGSLRFLAFAVVATAVLLVGIYRYGLPAMAEGAAAVTPAGVVKLIDAGVLDTVDRVVFSPSRLDEARQGELTKLFAELSDISGETNPPTKLLFRDGGRIGANAIALPGGTIILTDQLEALAENDDELAGVLAHEIGHVELRHSLRQIYRVLGIAFMVSVIGGDSGQIVEDVIAQAAVVESLSYTRKFESQADRHSVGIMLEAGRNPVAFVDLLERIAGDGAKDDKTGWLSTHPGSRQRRMDVEALVKAARQLE